MVPSDINNNERIIDKQKPSAICVICRMDETSKFSIFFQPSDENMRIIFKLIGSWWDFSSEKMSKNSLYCSGTESLTVTLCLSSNDSCSCFSDHVVPILRRAKNNFLRGPRGKIALQAGGIIWHLAMLVVQNEAVWDQDITHIHHHGLQVDSDDDLRGSELSISEQEFIVGTYRIQTSKCMIAWVLDLYQ